MTITMTVESFNETELVSLTWKPDGQDVLTLTSHLVDVTFNVALPAVHKINSECVNNAVHVTTAAARAKCKTDSPASHRAVSHHPSVDYFPISHFLPDW